ncbi:MAG: PAS domain-containing sensor histidine kinase [Ignavibacteriales bacterium]|nr:PAS domain-containing sensor histidine kinase [Ignavibacteriales bacterium]
MKKISPLLESSNISPKKILYISLTITSLIIFVFGYFIWSSNIDFQKFVNVDQNLNNLTGKIFYLDEVLTMSARLAAASGDLKWEKRYREFEPQLDSAIKVLKSLAPNAFITEGAGRTDSANVRLVEMENESFKMVSEGSLSKAAGILSSEEYNREKNIYHEGLEKVINNLRERTETSIDNNRIRYQWALVFIIISLITLIFVWLGSMGVMKRYLTQSKRIEKALKENEQTYRTIFESSADGMFLMTDVFRDCNNAVCKLFKCKKEDIIGHSPASFSPDIQPDGKNSFYSASEKIEAALNGFPQRFYWQHKTKDNTLFDAEVSLNAVIIRGENLIQAVVRDISERKKSEKIQEVLFEISEAAYSASDMYSLYKKIHAVVGTLMSSKNFYIALYDEKTGMIEFPYSIDEFDPPRPTRKFGTGLTEYVLRTGQAALLNQQKDLELRKKGEVGLSGSPAAIWLGVPLKIGGKSIGVITVQDYENEKAYGEEEMQLLIFVSEQIAQVIERKRNSYAIKKYTDELKQLNQTKDKFFSIIAHDLKNPFITILGFSDLLQSDYDELSDDERKFYIHEMKKSAEISYHLLQNLLHWSRAQTGRIELNPQKLELIKIINENFLLLIKTAEKKQIKLLQEVPDDLFILADVDMMNSIMRNLLTNAIKFSHKGGTIKVNAGVEENFVEITVTDNGIGMNPATIDNLFKLDCTQSTSGTENELGTGLGLILCKEFVERNGGKIRVTSEVGKGSKFIFTLPLI